VSKRRQIGDRVWVVPGASFGVSKGVWATIIDWVSNREPDPFGCCLCDDPNCREWDDLVTDDGVPLYHVSECQMLDEPQERKFQESWEKE